MATLKEEDPTAENDVSPEEDTEWELAFLTTERKFVDVLIDISEEESREELEPFVFHCYDEREEAASGWARVHPMSCILLKPKTDKKGKCKGATLTPLPDDPSTPASADSTVTPQRDASEWSFFNTLQETTSKSPHKEKIEQEGEVRETRHGSSKYVLENRPCKPQRHSHRLNSTVVPIKNFSFFPPIQPTYFHPRGVEGRKYVLENRPRQPQRHIHRPNSTVVSIENFSFLPPIKPSHFHSTGVSSKKALEGGTTEENYVSSDTTGLKRGTRVDSAAELQMSFAALTSKCQACQHNPHVLCSECIHTQEGYRVPLSSQPDTVHRTSYSVGTLLSSTAASPQAHINLNKTVVCCPIVRAVK